MPCSDVTKPQICQFRNYERLIVSLPAMLLTVFGFSVNTLNPFALRALTFKTTSNVKFSSFFETMNEEGTTENYISQ